MRRSLRKEPNKSSSTVLHSDSEIRENRAGCGTLPCEEWRWLVEVGLGRVRHGQLVSCCDAVGGWPTWTVRTAQGEGVAPDTGAELGSRARLGRMCTCVRVSLQGLIQLVSCFVVRFVCITVEITYSQTWDC